jgi:hypothetical protein
MKSNSTILFAIITLVIAAGAYWYFSTQTGNETTLTANVEENQTQTQFKMLVSEMNTISLSGDAISIFSDPKFLALTDLATQVTPEESGRLDPFAPIPGVIVK